MHADEMQLIADDMFTTLADTNGVGIAAPQISASWRMMILSAPDGMIVSRRRREICQSEVRDSARGRLKFYPE
nr:peptide deformylase [Bathymodiolus platifrons methanotrophic gill symbiont]